MSEGIEMKKVESPEAIAIERTQTATTEGRDSSPGLHDRKELKFEDGDNRKYTAFEWSSAKKWRVLIITAIIQCSMNFNASVYPNAIGAITKEFGVSVPAARTGQMGFLIAYAFGCELWAPWSEEIGRKPTLQSSLFLVNIFQIPAALAPNIGTMVAARTLGGLSSAGGSVTLGMVADMFQPHEHQYAVAHVVFASVGGALLGPIVGGFVGYYLAWRWLFWVQLAFGAFTQLLHLTCIPETRSDVLLDREARRRRNLPSDDEDYGPVIYGPNEIHGTLAVRMTWSKLSSIWFRPFKMLLTEPIVFALSLLSGFSDALIFTFLESFGLVFRQWKFNQWQVGLCFVPLLIGYIIAWLLYLPCFAADSKKRRRDGPESVSPERRLYLLMWLATLLPIGIFGFAWTSLGPAYGVHWIAPLIFATFIGVANWAIYFASIDYMVAAYGEFAASATGGNGFCRDLLAGIAAMYSTPLYELFPTHPLEYASTMLGCIAIAIVVPVFLIYFNGQKLREKSPFAKQQEQIIRQRTKTSDQNVQMEERV
ncbi:hypothetical protein AAFC00_004868 [Neodothiora populina]